MTINSRIIRVPIGGYSCEKGITMVNAHELLSDVEK